MSNFTAKAFLHTKDVNVRLDIVKQLQEFGYDSDFYFNDFLKYSILQIEDGDLTCQFDDTSVIQDWDGEDYIDCNTHVNGDEELAVKLFLELAQMREEDNRNDRFVRISEEYCEDLDVYVGFNFEQLWRFSEIDEVWQHVIRNATPFELAEAVKNSVLNNILTK